MWRDGEGKWGRARSDPFQKPIVWRLRGFFARPVSKTGIQGRNRPGNVRQDCGTIEVGSIADSITPGENE